MREILAGVAQIASDFGLAVLIIRHWTKGDRGKAIYRGSGSIDIIGLARAGIAVAIDPDEPDLRVMAHVKHNLSAPGKSYLYEIIKHRGARVPILKWRGTSSLTADQIQGNTSQSSAIESATKFVEEQLSGSSKTARTIKLAAEARSISARTLDRAKDILGVISTETKEGWVWSLPTRRTPAA
jgi:hypothetical protein